MKRGVTRRTFSGLAVGGVAASALAAPAAAMLRGEVPPAVDLLLFDDRFSDAGRFADAARAAGVRTLSTGGDLGALWFAGLRHELGGNVKRVAGMGRHSDFWIMQQLAADKGLSLKFRAEHDFRGRSAFTHRVPEAHGDLRQLLAAGSGSWSAGVAQYLTRARIDHDGGRLVALPASAAPGADHPGLLVSWVFAT